MVLAAGETFAGYAIESVLGMGGMGAVYLAKHPRLPRRDALKLMNPAYSADPTFRARFEREADLAAGLIHRNVVAVYDRGAVDGQLWISMQYVAGTDAAVAAKAEGGLSPERVVHIVTEVGAGLDFAHRAGLLHRDVKPANILLAPADDPADPEHVLLTDFSIAKSVDEVQNLTGTGNLLATLAYAAPEQIQSTALDRRVDIYALGCVLYELLTGSVPFPEPSPYATMNAHLSKPPPKPSQAHPQLPRGFDDVVAKAMAKNPDERYQTCRELGLAAQAALLTAAADAASSTPSAAAPTRGNPGSGDPRAADADTVNVVARSAAVGATPWALSTMPEPPFTITVRRRALATGAEGELGPIRTQHLPGAAGTEIEDSLNRARFFELPPRLPLEFVVPGDVFYEITVANRDISRSVSYERDGSRHPAELDAFVSRLEHHGQWHDLQPAAPTSRMPTQFTPTPATPSPLTPSPLNPQPVMPPQQSSQPLTPQPLTPQQSAAGGYPPPTPPGYSGPPGFAAGTSGYRTTLPPATPLPPAQLQRPDPLRKPLLIGLAVLVVLAVIMTIILVNKASGTPDTGGPATPTSTGPSTSTDSSSGAIDPDLNVPALVASVTDTGVTLDWNDVVGAASYALVRDGSEIYRGETSQYQDIPAPGSYRYEVYAIGDDGRQSAASDSVTAVISAWAGAQPLVDEFSTLLPATPADSGYHGASCVLGDKRSTGAAMAISCTDTDGVSFSVLQFETTATKDAYIESTWKSSPTTTEWSINKIPQGLNYKCADSLGKACVLTTFYAQTRATYLILSEWPGHTNPQLIDSWWNDAPF